MELFDAHRETVKHQEAWNTVYAAWETATHGQAVRLEADRNVGSASRAVRPPVAAFGRSGAALTGDRS